MYFKTGVKKRYTAEEREAIWLQYREDPNDRTVYNDLLEAYIPLVETIALKMKSSLPPQVEVGDLISEGFFGLVDAIEKFDEEKGFKFETYASNRIRGEINDSLRDFDWVSRYARLKFKLVLQTENELTQELGRHPTIKDIADRIGWTPDEVSKVQAQYNDSFSLNIDEHFSETNHEMISLHEMISDDQNPEASFALELSEVSSELEKALFTLSEQESVVMYLCMFEDMKFVHAAEKLGISATQLVKIYESAIEKLRERMT